MSNVVKMKNPNLHEINEFISIETGSFGITIQGAFNWKEGKEVECTLSYDEFLKIAEVVKKRRNEKK